MFAKKSLGQNFLHSSQALGAIVDAGDPNALDMILEIGPGKGALTERLLSLAGKVIAVEKDDYLYEKLREKFAPQIEAKLLDLVHGDILTFDPNALAFYSDLTYKIIANIPYNITGAIIRKFITARYQPERMILLVQKEVGQRIVSHDGKESILSLSVKAYGSPKIVGKVNRKMFSPSPSVDSVILSITNISKQFFDHFTEETFFTWVRAGFAQKRKKLIRNLEAVAEKADLEKLFNKLKINTNARAEELSLFDWKKLISGKIRTD